MAKVHINGLTRASTQEFGLTTTSRVMVSTSGLMVESTLVLGKIANFMVKECTSGLMVGYTMGFTWMTRSKAMDPMSGLMGENTKVTGMTANNTEKVSLLTPKANARLAFGRMENDSSGLAQLGVTLISELLLL